MMSIAGQRPRRRAVRLCLAACLGFLSAGCEVTSDEGPGHRRQVLALNPHQEHDLGEQAYREVLKKYAEVKVGKDAERVLVVGQRIARAAEIEPLQREINLRVKGYTWDWEFRLLRHPEINAFCLPGGKVAVFTGLMPVAENDHQLATVMAHEIAHALAHHASERVARQQKYETAVNAVNGALGRLPEEERRHLIGLLGAGAQARTLAYDRQQESEADHIGLFLMTFAGYDPDQALVFWQHMQRLSRGKQPPEILSDHPSDAHRMEQIRIWKTRAVAAKQAYDAGRIAPAR